VPVLVITAQHQIDGHRVIADVDGMVDLVEKCRKVTPGQQFAFDIDTSRTAWSVGTEYTQCITTFCLMVFYFIGDFVSNLLLQGTEPVTSQQIAGYPSKDMCHEIDPARTVARDHVPGVPTDIPGGKNCCRHVNVSRIKEYPDESPYPYSWKQISAKPDHSCYNAGKPQRRERLEIEQVYRTKIREVAYQGDHHHSHCQAQAAADNHLECRRESKEENHVTDEVPPAAMGKSGTDGAQGVKKKRVRHELGIETRRCNQACLIIFPKGTLYFLGSGLRPLWIERVQGPSKQEVIKKALLRPGMNNRQSPEAAVRFATQS